MVGLLTRLVSGGIRKAAPLIVVGLLTLLVSGGIRKAAPLIVVGLLVLVLAVTFSTLGNAKTNAKTLVGAVMYIFSGEQRRIIILDRPFGYSVRLTRFTDVH